MQSWLWGFVSASLVLLPISTATATSLVHVVCVGDSITHGHRASSRDRAYPSVLQDLLGSSYRVHNLGVSGTTMLKKGKLTYWHTTEFKHLLEPSTRADVLVLMFGTNDAKSYNWIQHGSGFISDYVEFIHRLTVVPDRKAVVYVAVPPPLYQDGHSAMNQTVINTILPDLVRMIAGESGASVIDVFNEMGGQSLSEPVLFDDGVHPNDFGYLRLAEAVLDAIVDGALDYSGQ